MSEHLEFNPDILQEDIPETEAREAESWKQEEEADLEGLKLKHQLCFPLYAASRKVIRKYYPLLEKLGMTYTQYIAMMVLWEHHQISAKELSSILYLDSGTLSPLLKSMEKKGWIERNRSGKDERVLMVEITPEGMALQKEAVEIPKVMGQCNPFSPEESMQLYQLLYKLLQSDL